MTQLTLNRSPITIPVKAACEYLFLFEERSRNRNRYRLEADL